jgi:hypothetical protein
MKHLKNWYKVLLNERIYFTANGQKIISPKLCVTESKEFLELFIKNRDIRGYHVKKLGLSVIKLSKILRHIVVVKIGEHYYIADGQHLASWLNKQNIPVEFMLVEVSREEELVEIMSQMNNSSVRWNVEQFAKVFAVEGNQYQKLLDLVKMYKPKNNITPKLLASIMHSDVYYFDNANKFIKEGYFEQNVPDKKVIKVLDALTNFYEKTKMTKSTYLNKALLILMYEKGKVYHKNEKKFISEIIKYIVKHKDIANINYGNKLDAISLVRTCWANTIG